MEEKLVKQLLKNYESEGIDMYALVDDPLFVQLPLEVKVKVIRKYAEVLAKGTSRALTKNDVRSIIKDVTLSGIAGAALGGASALAAASHFKGGFLNGGKLPLGSIAIGAALSGGLFATNTALRALAVHKDRKEVGNRLDDVVTNPTDESALKVLITRNQQINPNPNLTVPSAAENIVKDIIGQLPQKFMSDIVPAHIASRTFSLNKNSPIKAKYTSEQVRDIALRAQEAALNPNAFFKK